MGLRYSTWVLIWISFPFPRLLSVGHGKEGTFHNCIAKSSLQAGTSITISRQIDSHIASWWEQQQHALSRVQRSGGLSVEGAALAVILMETDGPPHSGDDPGHNLPSHTPGGHHCTDPVQSAGGTMAAWGGIDVAEHGDTGNTRPEEEVESEKNGKEAPT